MKETTEPPKRLRAGDVIDAQHDALMAALTRRTGGSVKAVATVNAKGDVQGSAEVTAELGTDLDELASVAKRAAQIAADTLLETIRLSSEGNP